jgi:hypothetical protein
MPKARTNPRVRVDRIELHDPKDDSYRFLIIDSDGDVYINEHSDESGGSIMFRKGAVPSLIKALRMATSL